MNKLLLALMATVLVGCDSMVRPDRCIHAETFAKCVQSSDATSDAIHACSTATHYISLREPSQIPKECR